jgi:phosphoribosyl-ATP pyrophosphohydrolase
VGRSEVLDRLFEVIEARRSARPQGSYVVSLLDGGHAAISAKVREEAEELIEAAAADDRAHTAEEAADLLFHCWVMLADADVQPEAVYRVLEARFGIGGLEEKAGRKNAE